MNEARGMESSGSPRVSVWRACCHRYALLEWLRTMRELLLPAHTLHHETKAAAEATQTTCTKNSNGCIVGDSPVFLLGKSSLASSALNVAYYPIIPSFTP
jgi:hypothetical protein